MMTVIVDAMVTHDDGDSGRDGDSLDDGDSGRDGDSLDDGDSGRHGDS